MGAKLACIGGTLAYDLLRLGALVAQRLGPQRTPFGDSQPIFRCESEAGEFLFLSRHGESGYDLAPSFINYRANIYALKSLEVSAIVSWSETRAIRRAYTIGEYVIVDDLVDETSRRANTFFDNLAIGVTRQWPVFCPTLRQAFAASLNESGVAYRNGGVYVCVEGPRLETPAEVRKFAGYGADLVGQTLAPETFLAKELQMCYASLCYVAKYAESGCDSRPFENGLLIDEAAQRRRAELAVERLPRILERLVEALHRTAWTCRCGASMAHHVASGQIGADWRSWFDDASAAAHPPARTAIP